MNYGVIVAAGSGERMGAKVDKAFVSLGARPVLAHSLAAFEKCHEIDGVVVVVRRERLDAARAMADMFGCSKVRHVVAGGARRQDSVMRGLGVLPEAVAIVAVHDGARPCVTPGLITETIRIAKRYGSGVAAVRINDTVKYVERGLTVTKTMDRTKLWAVQTPQTFKIELLREAFDHVARNKAVVTDEAAAVEKLGSKVRLVQSSVTNMKITTAEDLAVASTLLNFSLNHAP